MSNTISSVKREECYGCRSCEQICPKQCISVLPDNEGFLYPSVNEGVCANCGLCVKHCPVFNKIGDTSPAYLGLRLKDNKELSESASGGVFAGFADYILENGGVVFGCAFDENLQAQHIKINNKAELKLIKGSKYVASNTRETYREVSEILKDYPEKNVFYTGTPCQISGLYSFLGNKPEKLFTADIICHGVPSQKLFNKYIEWLSLKANNKIIYYGFRDKDVSGWTCCGKTKTKTKTKTINGAVDPYYSSFMRGETYRQCCYQCAFADIKKRPGDITMGDFWGVETAHPKFYSSKGVSCCLLNNDKGKFLFEKISSRFDFIETSADKITRKNGNLLRPTKKPAVRSSIYSGIDDLPVDKYISKLYAPLFKRIVRYMISLIPECVKILMKRHI